MMQRYWHDDPLFSIAVEAAAIRQRGFGKVSEGGDRTNEVEPR
jgi:hypothetical protein